MPIACLQRAMGAEELAQVQAAVTRRIKRAEITLRTDHPEIQLGTSLFAFQEMSSRGRQRYRDTQGGFRGYVEADSRLRCTPTEGEYSTQGGIEGVTGGYRGCHRGV
jgi:hypothetical protein